MGKEYVDACVYGEAHVLAHLLALVVGEGTGKVSREVPERSRVGLPHARRILRPERHEQGVAGGALDERPEGGALVLSHDEIALPVAGNRAVANLGWALIDRDHVYDFAPCFLAIPVFPVLAPVRPLLPERCDKRAFQRTPREHVDVLVDGFGRDAHGGVVRILPLKLRHHLLGRPFPAELSQDERSQPFVLNYPALAAPTRCRTAFCAPLR